MNNPLQILFIGDIVGRAGRIIAKDFLNDIKKNSARFFNESEPDFVIMNVENASHGFGLTKKNYEELSSLNIDCFTSGNHIWDKKDIFEYIDTAEKLIRPLNYPEGVKGVGYRIIEKNDIKIAVINLLGQVFMSPIRSPWEVLSEIIEEIKKITPIIFIDFHAEATAEKLCFANWASEYGISAVVGTHTHVQTADEKVINETTAYMSDVGFCGASESIIGMQYETSLKRLMSNLPARYEVDESPKRQLEAVLITIDKISGKAISIKRISYNKNYCEDNIC